MKAFLRSPLRKKTIEVIPNGVNEQVFKIGHQRKAQQRLGLDPRYLYGLFIAQGGEKNKRKGRDYFYALSATKNSLTTPLKWICLGGKHNREVDNIIYRPGNNDPRLIAKYYQASDFLIFPSLADNCPLSVIEAFASGLPVLAFDTSGVSELIRHKKNGFLATYKSQKSLEMGLAFILKNRQKMHIKPKARLTRARMAKSFENVFRKVSKAH